ncbi:MAG: Trm112 family protein [Alphaproteobacteria bacterium]|nr:Trm112 family protein [Alphaproteobacteria bacterium]
MNVGNVTPPGPASNVGATERDGAGDDEAAPLPATEIDPRLLEVLVCPSTKKPLSFDRERMELISVAAGVAFPIRDGVPIMLMDEARPLDEREIARFKARP